MEINIKDKFVFILGRDYSDIFQISIFFKIGNYGFQFGLVPENYKKISYEKDGQRFQNQELWYTINLSILQFIFIDYTGTNIIHFILDEEKEYTPYSLKPVVDKFKSVLKHNIKYNNPYSLFDVNYSIKPNGNYIYYFTVRNNSWFIEHDLGLLISQRYPDCYLSKEQIKYYFPKYHEDWVDRKYHQIYYQKLDIYEKEET